MGGAAASRIPPTWGYSRDEAFELAGGSKPGSHWDEARWESLKNDEGFIPAKAWKSEVARINQEVMQKMMEQQQQNLELQKQTRLLSVDLSAARDVLMVRSWPHRSRRKQLADECASPVL